MKSRKYCEKFLKKNGVVYFDFDQTLAQSEGLQMCKWNNILRKYGDRQISLDEYILRYCGKSSSDEIPRCLIVDYPELGSFSVKELADMAAAEFERLMTTNSVRLMPGAKKFHEIIEKNKWNCCVVSGKDQKQLAQKLEAAHISGWFPNSRRVSEADAGGKGKPDPAMYRYASKILPSASKAVAFEDQEAGVNSAKAAGVGIVVALPSEFSLNQDFSSADYIAKGFNEIIREWVLA